MEVMMMAINSDTNPISIHSVTIRMTLFYRNCIKLKKKFSVMNGHCPNVISQHLDKWTMTLDKTCTQIT